MNKNIHEMTDKEIEDKLKQLKDDYQRTYTYGSPWGANVTQSECAIINEQILTIENMLLSRKLKESLV